jgi:hypothetical protein
MCNFYKEKIYKQKQLLMELLKIAVIGVEPIRPKRTPDFESGASANSATPPSSDIIN